MTRDQAIDHLQIYALKHGKSVPNSPSYLPKTGKESRNFQPHEWVIDALVNCKDMYYD